MHIPTFNYDILMKGRRGFKSTTSNAENKRKEFMVLNYSKMLMIKYSSIHLCIS